MADSIAREIGLLRMLASHLEKRAMSFDEITQKYMRNEGIGHVKEKAEGIIAIRAPGHLAFTELSNCLLDHFPAMARGAIYDDVQTELFIFIENYIDREPFSVGCKDVEALFNRFETWFAARIADRRIFVPCVISRRPARRFEIGPVTFEFIDHLSNSDFVPRRSDEESLDRRGFEDLVKWMRDAGADWLARVSVNGCERRRAQEIAELSADLAIVALQLAAPSLDTHPMSRLNARRGTSQKRTFSEANGFCDFGWSSKEPGFSIGPGTLQNILQMAAPVFMSTGNVVRSFASGTFRLPALEGAWCDAAYWFHQALGESIDTIAIAKLETALEVLLRSESSKGSERRMLQVLKAFFDLEHNDPVAPGSPLTAKQFARNLVRDRSRILHGTWSTLSVRGIDRKGMERFTATVLRKAVIELDAYVQSRSPTDDVDKFLDWVQQRTGAPSNK